METPTRVVFPSGKVLYYYNKLTGEIDIFCFDPLCEHESHLTCTAQRFAYANQGNQTIRYSDYDDRFYALRGEQLVSFAFDGSDFRYVASFGENGKLGADYAMEKYGVYDMYALKDLSIWDHYACFTRKNEQGNMVLSCYDMKTGIVSDLIADVDTNVSIAIATENGIYMSLHGNYAGIFCINYDGQGLTQICNDYSISLHGIYDGENTYFLQRLNPSDLSDLRSRLVSAPLGSVETTVMIPEVSGAILLTATDDAIYYKLSDDNEKNYYSKIFRYSKKTGETITVYDDLRYEITYSMFLIGDHVIIDGAICNVSETGTKKEYTALIGRIDENGMIVDLEPVA